MGPVHWKAKGLHAAHGGIKLPHGLHGLDGHLELVHVHGWHSHGHGHGNWHVHLQRTHVLLLGLLVHVLVLLLLLHLNLSKKKCFSIALGHTLVLLEMH